MSSFACVASVTADGTDFPHVKNFPYILMFRQKFGLLVVLEQATCDSEVFGVPDTCSIT